MFACACPCLTVLTRVCLCLPVLDSAYPCLPVLARACPCLTVLTRVCLCLPALDSVCQVWHTTGAGQLVACVSGCFKYMECRASACVHTMPDETCAEKITEEAHQKQTHEEVLNVLTSTTTGTTTGEASAKQSADQEQILGGPGKRLFFFHLRSHMASHIYAANKSCRTGKSGH